MIMRYACLSLYNKNVRLKISIFVNIERLNTTFRLPSHLHFLPRTATLFRAPYCNRPARRQRDKAPCVFCPLTRTTGFRESSPTEGLRRDRNPTMLGAITLSVDVSTLRRVPLQGITVTEVCCNDNLYSTDIWSIFVPNMGCI